MVKFHVLLVPAFYWGTARLETLDDLANIMEHLRNLFNLPVSSYQLNRVDSGPVTLLTMNDLRKEKIDSAASIFSWSLPGLRHEVEDWNYAEITPQLRAVAKEEWEELHINRAFLTAYGLELVSSDSRVLSRITEEYDYTKLMNRLSVLVFPSIFSVGTDKEDSAHPLRTMAIVANLKVIVCKDKDEIAGAAKELDLEESIKGLWTPKQGSDYSSNGFNFLPGVWQDAFMPNLVAVQEDQLDSYPVDENLGDYVATCLGLGKLFSVSESITGVRVLLQLKLMVIDDFFSTFEKEQNWFKRNFSNLSAELDKVMGRIRSSAQEISMFAKPDVVNLIQNYYGGSWFSQVEFAVGLLTRGRSVAISDGSPLANAFTDNMRKAAREVSDFMKELKETAVNWRELQTTESNQRQLIIAIAAVIVAIVTLWVTAFPFGHEQSAQTSTTITKTATST